MRKKKKKNIAFKENTVAIESLPSPIVLYPGFYGAYFGFRRTTESPTAFCSCAFESIENYLKIKSKIGVVQKSTIYNSFIVDSGQFPLSISKELVESGAPNEISVLKHLVFEDKLCHQCNKCVPTFRYCHEMYGGVFKQTYGWYIQKKGLEYGLFGEWDFHPEYAPQEIIDMMEITPQAYRIALERSPAGFTREGAELSKNYHKQFRKIWNIVENEVRKGFGHNKIGDSWVSETILYHIIKSIYPEYTVHRHYRPKYLGGLELDIYIEELNTGIEYQGIQHFEPVDYWGGVDSFKRGQERDIRKKKVCKEFGLRLIYFNHDEPLERQYAINKIQLQN